MSAIFLSHSSKDDAAASVVRTWLAGQGHQSVFLDFDPVDGIPAGRNWEQEIYAEIKACRALVLLCSVRSMASHWCFAEIAYAHALGKLVFPVKIAPCELHPLLQSVQVVDASSDIESHLAQLGRGLREAGLDPADTFDRDASRAPYPGLPCFDEKDAAVFFGRDADIRAGLDALRRQIRFRTTRFLLFLGASGSGKSSLLRAGIIPRLRRDPQRWIVVPPFRPLDRPVEGLAMACAEAFDAAGRSLDWRALRAGLEGSGAARLLGDVARDLRVATRRLDATVLFPIDQCEELFTLSGQPEADRFLALVRELAEDPSSNVIFVATMRSDFLGNLQSRPGLNVMEFAQVLVNPIAFENVSQTIEGPASVAGLELEPGLTQALVQDTAVADALPLLAFTLRELWEHRDGARLTLRLYRDELGGLSGAVARAAEEAMAPSLPLTSALETSLRKAFLAMVRVNEDGRFTRRPAPAAALPQETQALLERFVIARLLIASERDGSRTLEVAHEKIFGSWSRLAAWLNIDREFLLWRERLRLLLSERRRNPADPGTLLRGAVLAEAQGWLQRNADQLSAEERAFIDASEALRAEEQLRAEAQRLRELEHAQALAHAHRRATLRAQVIAGVVLAAAVALGYLARLATNERENAVSRELAANAALLRTEDAELGLRIALEALRVTPTIEAQKSFREALVGYNESHSRTVFEGHSGSVRWATISKDGKFVATASEDGTVAVWNRAGGDPLRVLSAPERMGDSKRPIVYQVDFDPTGAPRLIAAGQDGHLRAWRTDTGTLEFDLDTSILGQVGAALRAASYSHNGGRIVTASESGDVAVWDAGTRQKIFDLTSTANPRDIVYGAGFSPNDGLIATAARDGKIRVFDGQSGALVRELVSPEQKPFRAAVFSPDGTMLLGIGEGTRAPLWEVGRWRLLGALDGHTQILRAASFSPDSKLVATAGGDHRIRIYEIGTPAPVIEFPSHKGSVNSLQFTADGSSLLASSGDGTARMWAIKPGLHRVALQGHTGAVRGVAFNWDASRTATASEDGSARVWETETGRQVSQVRHRAGWVTSVALSLDGEVVLTAGTDGSARIWDVSTQRQLQVLEGHRNAVYAAAFGPGDRLVASAGRDGTARIWETRTGEQVASCSGHQGRVTSVAFAQEDAGMRIVTTGEDATARVWRWSKSGCDEVLSISTRHGWTSSVALDPSSTRFVTAGEDGALRIWDTRSGKELKEIRGHDGWVHQVSWIGKRIVSAGQDGTASVWDAESGERVSFVPARAGWWVYAAQLGGRGDRIVVGSEDGSAVVHGREFLDRIDALTTVDVGVRKLTPFESKTYLRSVSQRGWVLHRE